MADAKITALPASTTPLAGTEVLPVVQSGTTKQVSVANLTAGRDVGTKNLTSTGDISFDGGNFVFNNSNAVKTFRIAGDNDGSLFYTDATNDRVAVGTQSPPSGKFGVAANVSGGYTALELQNLSTAATNGKYAQVAFTGRDTVNSWKAGAYLRGKPADDNLVGYGLQVFVRNSDTVAQSAEFTYQGNIQVTTAGKGILLPGGITWTSGSGSPEGVVTAPVGSLYSRSDGGAGTSLYVKESGSGNTGWAGK